jgi:GntR family transcriptional repressor for pyruvate dehydrogenase complex
VRAVDEVIDELRQAILSGRLARGARLPTERDLAREYRVSQPTVREGLRVLEALGLIQVEHGRGAFVNGDGQFMLASTLVTLLQFERIGMLEVLAIREMLGRESVFLAAQRATDVEITEMSEAVQALGRPAEVRNVEELIARVSRYSQALSRASHTPLLTLVETFLASLLLQTQVQVLKKRSLSEWIARSSKYQRAREAIVDRIANHDARGAHAAMEHFLGQQRAMFEGDPILRTLRISDPKITEVIRDLMERFGAR